MTFDDFLGLLPGPRKSGSEYIDLCPVHEPPGLKHKTRSLNVRQKGRWIVMQCRSGNCGTRAICGALGVDPRDLDTNLPGRIVKAYSYMDAANHVAFQKTRHEPGSEGRKKSFLFWHPDAQAVSGWKTGLNGIPHVLYRLPQVLKNPLIFLPEGEKDSDFLESLGIPDTAATTGSTGTSGWDKENLEPLRGKLIFIFPDNDNDAKGEKFAEEKARSLHGIALGIKIVKVPPEFRDVEHWHPSKEVLQAAMANAPEWSAPPEIEIPEAVEQPAVFVQPDVPDSCLQGHLGEWCQKRMKHFPLAYAWPALLCVGASKLDEQPFDVRANLFGALVGEVHSGKSQAIDFALRILGVEPPQLVDAFIGSAEALALALKDANGNPRIWCPDELAHPFAKFKIENSGFAPVLTRMFGHTKFTMRMGKQKSLDFNCAFSLLGGVVEDNFQDLFNYTTNAGLWDRMLFGLYPTNFQFIYRRFSGFAEKFVSHAVEVHPEIEDWQAEFLQRNPNINQRVVEIAIRCATICAMFDGVRKLRFDRMDPHIEFIKYQTRVRKMLQPNPGENFEGQIANKILQYLASHPGWQKRRDVYRAIHASDKGPSIFARALDGLWHHGLVARRKEGKQWWLKLPEPNEEVDMD